MPEPLKNLYSPALITRLAKALKKVYPKFESTKFKKSVIDQHWSDKELKQRIHHVTFCLKRYLPDNYIRALNILKKISSHFSGLEHLFFADFVELYGLDHFPQSIVALELFTQHSTSELAVRPFIVKYPNKMMQQMNRWSRSKNYHLRRLSSEGCRPRLPWAMALTDFKNDPAPILNILARLKQDDSDYVRRSVANNLNDISKDHPQLVYDLTKQWLGRHADTDKLLKHACRTLLKRGEAKVLSLFGFKQAKHVELSQFKIDKSVKLGQLLNFSFRLKTNRKQLGKLRIEYALGFMRANGALSYKVFKISESNYLEQNKEINKTHSFKKISTRRYYPGIHSLAIIVNGTEVAKKRFQLT